MEEAKRNEFVIISIVLRGEYYEVPAYQQFVDDLTASLQTLNIIPAIQQL
jgi:hypothetical protein